MTAGIKSFFPQIMRHILPILIWYVVLCYNREITLCLG